MPLSIVKRLGKDSLMGRTQVLIQLADKTVVTPCGMIEDMLVQLDKFVVPADFIIIDMEEDLETPLILGRPFLATCDATLRMKDSSIEFLINGEQIRFDMNRVMKNPSEGANVCIIDVIDECVEAELENWIQEDHDLEEWMKMGPIEDHDVEDFLKPEDGDGGSKVEEMIEQAKDGKIVDVKSLVLVPSSEMPRKFDKKKKKFRSKVMKIPSSIVGELRKDGSKVLHYKGKDIRAKKEVSTTFPSST